MGASIIASIINSVEYLLPAGFGAPGFQPRRRKNLQEREIYVCFLF
jgi:hypothetical protein